MGSELQRIKAAVNSFAQTTERTGQNLSSQRRELERSAQQVNALIGGSATSKDREVSAAIQQAQHAVEQAGAALQKAARTARQYAASI